MARGRSLSDTSATGFLQVAEYDTSFERALPVVLFHEGGLSDDPSDPGGITKFGVSVRFAGSVGIDINGNGRTTGEDIRALTVDQATRLYFNYFWRPLRCTELPPGVALIVFDGGVNQGRAAIAKLLQRAVGVAADGIIGRDTLHAVALWNDKLGDLVDEVAARRAPLRPDEKFRSLWSRLDAQAHARTRRGSGAARLNT